MSNASDAINSLLSNGLAATVFGFAASAVLFVAVYALNQGQKRAAKLAALALQRWPVINFALATIENQVDEAVEGYNGGRYLPAYEVAKQLFTDEQFSFEDAIVMADFIAKEFSSVKYEKFKAKDMAGMLTISESERQIGQQVAGAILSTLNKDLQKIQTYKDS